MMRAWLIVLALAFSLLACSSDDGDSSDPSGDGDGDGDGSVDERELPDIQPIDSGTDTSVGEPGDGDGDACEPIGEVEHDHTSEAADHVLEPLAASSYNSSPPSSGSHCGAWAAYATFDADFPLPACNFLHNLEHGAIVLLYNCPDGCAEITDVLEEIIAAPPENLDTGCIKPRLVLTPYSEMDVKVAAAAWGFTWTSDCMDAAARDSLEAFIAAHIGASGEAPEPNVCGDGSVLPQ